MRTIKQIKKWQIEALQLGRPARHFLIQSPGGAGKSLLQVLLAQADIEDTGNKQLILVPKNHIHHGFFDDDCIEFVLPGERRASRWAVQSNFCSTSKNDGKTKLLKQFLLADVRDLRSEGKLAAIATHRAMVGAWALMSRRQKITALRNVSFRIDEAHHLSNVFHDSDLDLFNVKDKEEILDDATRLGRFLQYVLRHDEQTVKVHLTTATFFRGDQRTILSERFKSDFAHYYLPWDEHFQTLGIEHLTFDFINYHDDPIDSLLNMIESEPDERHLIIIPALTHRYWSRGIRIGNKCGDLPEIGMSSFALNGRLTWNYKTTLAKEVEKILGPQAKPLTLPKVIAVIRKYRRKGIRLHRKFGRIPELDMSSHNLADRLKRNFDVKLSELVEEAGRTKAG